MSSAFVARLFGALAPVLGDAEINYKDLDNSRLRLKIEPSILREVAGVLFRDFNARFITISCLDEGDVFRLLYHLELVEEDFTGVLSLQLETLKTEPVLPSLFPVTPVAEYIEQEVNEFFGLSFEGNPRENKMILPEDWKEGEHPLAKPDPKHFGKNVEAIVTAIIEKGASVKLGDAKMMAAREKMGLPPLPALASQDPLSAEALKVLVERSGIYKQLPSARKKKD